MGESRERDSKLKVLRALRWMALPLAIILFVSSIRSLIDPPFEPDWFFRMRSILEIGVGILLLLPFGYWARKAPEVWKRMFFLLLMVAIVFVFTRVIGVLFEAREAEAAGGELGLPAWTGTLIFLVLAQLPILLFLRFPDQLD